ncbi:MAG: helix-turn-helix transcriptional regulator [Blastocatellia bacterium]
MNQTAENLRFLLWKQKKPREHWATELARMASCTEHRAEKLLQGSALTTAEQKAIAQLAHCQEEDIQSARFLGEEVNVLFENIRFLTDKKITGITGKEMASAIGVTEVTLSRWKNRKQTPEANQLARLCQFLHISPRIDLKSEAIFLSSSPIGDFMRRQWLRQQIEEIDSQTLRDLFPALERMFK